MIKHKRVQWLDFEKGIGILAVFIAHFLVLFTSSVFLSYSLFICIMPVFFSVSGFLYKPTYSFHTLCISLYKKFVSLLIPLFLFLMIYLVLYCFVHNIYDGSYYKFLCSQGLYLWFIWTLFLIFLIFDILNLIHINIYVQLIISILLLLTQCFFKTNGFPNVLTGTFGYLFFFYNGYLFKLLFNNSKVRNFISNYIFSLILLLVYLIINIYFINFEGIKFPNIVRFNNVLIKLFSVYTSFILCINLNNLNHSEFFKYFAKYGKYTLVIYMIHFPIILVVSKIIMKIGINCFNQKNIE